MALGDKQVLNSQVADGNSDYLIPGAVSLQLKAVQALFTDNGAGGDWLPAVVAISDSGHVLWRACDQGVKVTAGSDAEVSWFPGVKHAAAAAAAGAELCIAASASPYNIPATGGSPNAATTWASVTPATGTFVWPSSGDSSKIGLTKSGVYQFVLTSDAVAVWPAPATGFITFTQSLNIFGNGFLQESPFLNTTTTALFAGTSGRSFTWVGGVNLPAADEFQLFAGNSTAGNFAVAFTRVLLARVGDYLPGAPI